MAFAGYLIFTGPCQLSRYPAREASPYRLPWPAGVTYLCGQSNRGVVSHRGWGEFAFDFKMDEGSPVCAARGGVVTHVNVSRDGHGYHAPNNYIGIDHGDGTTGWYLHLQRSGSLVRIDDVVAQGQQIGLSGHVGHSVMPHLHFHVEDHARRATIPITFADVLQHRGIPRMGFRYTSGNIAP